MSKQSELWRVNLLSLDVTFTLLLSKFNTKKYFTGSILQVAEKIEEQIQSELPSRLQVNLCYKQQLIVHKMDMQESSEDLFKEAGVNDALLKLEELRATNHDTTELPW